MDARRASPQLVFVATTIEEVSRVARPHGMNDGDLVLRIDDVGEDGLVALWSTLCQMPLAEERGISSALVHSATEEGPFVLAVDEDFLFAVASVEHSRALEVVARWRELRWVGGFYDHDWHQRVDALSAFARTAKHRGLSVFQIVGGAAL